MKIYQTIKKPMLTEKGTKVQETANQYIFAVDPKATKYDVKGAVEDIFKVKVTAVRTMTRRGKVKRVGAHYGRKPSWKKAVVTLKEGDRIEFLEGT